MMKYLTIFLILTSSLTYAQQESNNWEGLDLEREEMKAIEKQREQYKDREGDLQIQEEEEEIYPIESEDSRSLKLEDDYLKEE